MNTQLILAHMGQFIELSQEEIDFLSRVLISRPFKRNEIISQQGEPARYLAFVNAGYTVTYYTDANAMDHVIRFAAPGWWAGDMYSLSEEPNTPLTTKGLSTGDLLLLPHLAHGQLLAAFPKFERYFRQLFQTALMRQQLRFVESHSQTADQRYTQFQKTFPGIEQYLPQKYIASYLGVTPEFLSKIRRNRK